MNRNHDYQIEQMVLAFDSSGCSLLSIEHIVYIASQLKSSIQAVYIEDSNLLTAAQLPFTREISLRSAQSRKLDTQQLTRHFQALAGQIRSMLETQSRMANIQSTFRVMRGHRIQTILQEALHAPLVFLPAGSRMMHSNKPRFVAVMAEKSGTIPCRLATLLANRTGLHLLVVGDDSIRLSEALREHLHPDANIRYIRQTDQDIESLLKQLKPFTVDVLIIPQSHSLLQQTEQLQRMADTLKCDIMVTRDPPDNPETK